MRAQREVKRLQYPPLGNLVQVDQQIAAADEIEAREWRVVRDILPREDAQIANALHDAEAAVVHLEEPLQALTRDVSQDISQVDAGPCLFERRLADIGAEDLNFRGRDGIAEAFQQLDRERVHLFAGRAARDPDPDWLSGVAALA